LNDPKPRFKVTPLFDATYLSQKQYDIHNGIIPGTYARLTQVCHFKWCRVFKPSDVLNDAKHRAVSLRQLSFVLCVCIMFTLFCAAICRDKQCIIRMYYNVCIAVKCAWVQCWLMLYNGRPTVDWPLTWRCGSVLLTTVAVRCQYLVRTLMMSLAKVIRFISVCYGCVCVCVSVCLLVCRRDSSWSVWNNIM